MLSKIINLRQTAKLVVAVALISGILFIFQNCTNSGLNVTGLVSQDSTPQSQSVPTEVPGPAAGAGYLNNTFSSNAFTATNTDVNQTNKPGFQWYPFQLFDSKTNLSAIVLNADHSLLLNGDTTGPNGELASVVPISTAPFFKGIAFGGGGYFEAVLKFNPNDVIAAKFKGWPSWWSLALEHFAALPTARWPGQASNYSHFIEADFLEYDDSGYIDKGETNYLGGALRDWYGIYNTTCSGFCNVTLPYSTTARKLPVGTDFTQYHRFGFLWIPATATTQGSAQYFFDGVQVGLTTNWSMYTGQSPPPGSPWTYSIIDVDHLVLILGTGVGEPMTVQSVNVWQKSDTKNLSN